MAKATPDKALGHWCMLYEGLHAAPADFYRQVEAAVAERKIQDLAVERVEYREGGAFSGFRTYLRVARRRDTFDICGAPFGNGFFFSWWFSERRPALPGFLTIMVVFVYLGIVGWFANEFGMFKGPILLLFLVPVLLLMASQLGTPGLDDFILMLPGIGMLYGRLFRPITFYRIDTSLMFQRAVEAAVMEVIDRMASGQGIRALSELERKPVMRDFFKK